MDDMTGTRTALIKVTHLLKLFELLCCLRGPDQTRAL